MAKKELFWRCPWCCGVLILGLRVIHQNDYTETSKACTDFMPLWECHFISLPDA
jgi:hypothetical protein